MAEQKLDIIIEAKAKLGDLQSTVKALEALPNAAKKADAGVSTLGRSIAALKAKLDAAKFDKEGFFDPAKIAASNREIQKLEAEIRRLDNVGKVGFDSLGNAIKGTTSNTNALTKGFSFLRTAANILPGIGIAGIFGVIGGAIVGVISKLAQAGHAFTAMNEVIGTSAEETFKAKKKFDDLLETLNSSGTSFTAQKNALKAINESLKEYGVQLNSVAEAQKFGAQISAIVSEIRGEEAKQTALAALAAHEYAKQVQLLNTAQSGGIIEVTEAVGGLTLLKNAILNFNSPAAIATTTVKSFAEKAEEAANSQKFFSGEIDKSRGTVKGLEQVLKALTHPLDDTKVKTEKAAKAVKELKATFRAFQGLATEGNNGLIFDAVIKFRQDKVKEQIKNIQDFVNAVNNPVEIPISLGKLKIDVNIQDALDKAEASFKILESRVKEFRGRLFDIIKGMAVDTVSGFAEGIGKALAGEKNPFGAILTVLADGLQSLGKMVIATFITLAALDKALKSIGITNPVVGIAIGAAMVALGAFIKSKVSQTKFAEGGIVSGPMNATIGEAGQSEVVIPLSRLSGMLNNGGGNGGRVEFIISGQNLLGTLNRATSSYGRTYG